MRAAMTALIMSRVPGTGMAGGLGVGMAVLCNGVGTRKG
jgi:hypothetical protein